MFFSYQWDEGLLTMSRGEKAELTIEPEWAYGRKGKPDAKYPFFTPVLRFWSCIYCVILFSILHFGLLVSVHHILEIIASGKFDSGSDVLIYCHAKPTMWF